MLLWIFGVQRAGDLVMKKQMKKTSRIMLIMVLLQATAAAARPHAAFAAVDSFTLPVLHAAVFVSAALFLGVVSGAIRKSVASQPLDVTPSVEATVSPASMPPTAALETTTPKQASTRAN
jgi:hypothetical protein